MSPKEYQRPLWPARFPRVSGDEPAAGNLQATIVGFSPRERG